MSAIIITNPNSSLAIADGASGDPISILNGPPENGFQTSELVDATGMTIFANQTNFTVDGGNTKHLVTLDNPNPRRGWSLYPLKTSARGARSRESTPAAPISPRKR